MPPTVYFIWCFQMPRVGAWLHSSSQRDLKSWVLLETNKGIPDWHLCNFSARNTFHRLNECHFIFVKKHLLSIAQLYFSVGAVSLLCLNTTDGCSVTGCIPFSRGLTHWHVGEGAQFCLPIQMVPGALLPGSGLVSPSSAS